MHDVEAASARAAGVLASEAPLPPCPAPYRPREETRGRMILPFIGGLGDALSLEPVLASIHSRHEHLRIDIAATPGPGEVFSCLPAVDDVRPYPLTLEQWGAYDRYLSLECVLTTAQRPGRPLPETFADAIGLPLIRRMVHVEVPDAWRSGAPLTDGPAPLVGLAIDDMGSLRAYPAALTAELIDRLLDARRVVALLGAQPPAVTHDVPRRGVIDLRGRTTTVAALARVLLGLDAIVAHDSFVLHLAGALGLPSIGLFAPTSAHHAEPYPEVRPLASDAPCAPCHVAVGTCPKGYGRCLAWQAPAVSPAAIAQAVQDELMRAPRAVA
jgi:ADP-heptose:LPS heptosyltransferase